MKSKVVYALILLNVLLLMSFLARLGRENIAQAQPQGAARPGDYIMVPGEVTGGNAGVVYVVDTTHGLLSAITYNETGKRLETMPKVDLGAVFAKGAEAIQNRGGTNDRNKPRGR
jgi:hypothetical protein